MRQPDRCAGALSKTFCQFIMMPINQLMCVNMDDQKEKYDKMMRTLAVR